MFRVIFNTLLIVTAVTLFLIFTRPQYDSLSKLRSTLSSRNDVVNNSGALKDELRKKQAAKSSIDINLIDRLNKIVPADVDSVFLIIEVDDLARRYGMSLKSPRFSSKDVVSDTRGFQTIDTKPYNVFTFEFVVDGSYDNFMEFLRDVERNMRLFDVTAVSFMTPEKGNTISFRVSLNTYWLKK